MNSYLILIYKKVAEVIVIKVKIAPQKVKISLKIKGREFQCPNIK